MTLVLRVKVRLQRSFTKGTSQLASLRSLSEWPIATAWCCSPPTLVYTSSTRPQRDTIVLPKSHRNKMEYLDGLPVGSGLDPSIGRYKVARSFYRGSDDNGHVVMGMEVFTINGVMDEWRETLVDLPALITCPQTATHCKGYLFYFIDKANHPCPPRALLRFNLQQETFGFTPLLDTLYPQVQDKDIILHEL